MHEAINNAFEELDADNPTNTGSLGDVKTVDCVMTSTTLPVVNRKKEVHPLPVDKGWAWVVLFAVFMKELLFAAIHKSFGVIYLAMLDNFDASSTSTSWIGALAVALAFLFGPVASILNNTFSVRTLCYVSGLMAFLGFLLTMFIPRIEYLYLTYSILIGLADGLVLFTVMGLIRAFFDKHRGLAVGVAFSSAGLGGVVGAPFFTFLYESYGLKGTLLILSAIMLNVLVFASLMTPPEFYTRTYYKCTSPKTGRIQPAMKANSFKYSKQSPNTKAANFTQASSKGALTKLEHPQLNVSVLSSEKHELDESSMHTPGKETTASGQETTSSCGTSKKLFRAKAFSIFIVSVFVIHIGYLPLAFFLLPVHGDNVGLNKMEAALLVTTAGIGSVFGRPIFGVLADRKFINITTLFCFTHFATSLTALIMPSAGNNLTALLILSTCLGFFSSANMTLPLLILTGISEHSSYDVAIRWLTVSMGVPSLFARPFFAFTFEVTGTWAYAFYGSGAFILLGSGLLLISEQARLRRKNNVTVTSMGRVAEKTISTHLYFLTPVQHSGS